jgi:putative flippase GtrA
MEKIKKIWSDFTKKLYELWQRFSSWVIKIWKKLSAFATSLWEKVSCFVVGLWQKISAKVKPIWDGFADKNPKAAQWVREGGLFFLVSNFITLFKYLILTFLPLAFAFMGNRDFGFPGIDLTLFGIEFKWYIIGYGADQGGLSYFTAYMIAMVIGEVINFFIQRKYVFRSKGNILWQGAWYLLAFCLVTCVVNSINCIWIAVASNFVKGWLYNIVTTVLNGGVSMVVFFVVNKIVFNDAKTDAKKAENA